MRFAVLIAAVCAGVVATLEAHSAPFSYLDLRVDAGTSGALVVHDYDAAHDLGIDRPELLQEAGVVASHRDVLVRLMDLRLAISMDGQRQRLHWGAVTALPDRQSIRLMFTIPSPAPGQLRVEAELFPYDPVHQTFVNVYEGDELRYQTILDSGRRWTDYYAGTVQGVRAVVGTFVPAGINHILIGPDHILFLVGLLLLGGSLLRLAMIVTAFTIGHSITLSLAALDIVSPPARVIEPAIALSIIFVGADNLLVAQRKEQARDIRPWIAGIFGLVHGFGFAAVLKEFGLPTVALGWSLFSFNLGVEIGQLALVMVVASGLVAVRKRNATLAERLAFAGSIFVIAAGSYWFVQRVFMPGAVS